VEDADFALEEGLLPPNMAQGSIWVQFNLLAEQVELSRKQKEDVLSQMLSEPAGLRPLVQASFLGDKYKRSYLQAYQTRLKNLKK